MTLRPISRDGFGQIAIPRTFGKPAQLEWLAIADLVVDPEYQREITNVGHRNVARIAMTFSWSMFAPVIVSAAGSGKYAIVDGQHRTTAAAICGIECVPCCIIDAKRGEQAAAFKAINANITRMHTTMLHRAAVTAGDEKALRIHKICEKAGVAIAGYPKPASHMASNETIAVAALENVVQRFDEKIVVLSLSLLAKAGGGIAGSLKRQAIIGTTEVLNDHPEWTAQPLRLTEAFADLDIPSLIDEAFSNSASMRGVSATNRFEADLLEILTEHFKAGRAA